MVCFQTKNPNFGKFWRVFAKENLDTYILWPFGLVYGHWKYLKAIWYILWSFGIFSLFWEFLSEKNLATLIQRRTDRVKTYFIRSYLWANSTKWNPNPRKPQKRPQCTCLANLRVMHTSDFFDKLLTLKWPFLPLLLPSTSNNESFIWKAYNRGLWKGRCHPGKNNLEILKPLMSDLSIYVEFLDRLEVSYIWHQ
jgi:hypothetical protein